MRVFLSYRRTDVGGYAGRLADGLSRRLGARSLFQDVATVAPGQDFAAAIDRALDACDVLLAVIGPGWLTATDASGARRLDAPRDYVRVELARALQRDVRVVPVLVGGAALPSAQDLPDDLQGLVLRQATRLRDETWHHDLDGLVRALRGQPALPRRSRRLQLVAVGLAVAGVAAALWWPGTDEDSSVLPACAVTTGSGWTPLTLTRDPEGSVDVQDGALLFAVRSATWRTLQGGAWQVTLRTSMTNSTTTSQRHGEWRYAYLSVSGRQNQPTCFTPAPDEVVAPQQIGDATVGFQVSCPPTGYLKLALYGDDDRRLGALDVTASTASTGC